MQWPYVKDELSKQAVRAHKAFPVSTCWNGAVVLKAEPFLHPDESANMTGVSQDRPTWWRRSRPVIDQRELSSASFNGSEANNTPPDPALDPSSLLSPNLTRPLSFRVSRVDGCVNSECFLLPYDLHRLYADINGRPRIWINPDVLVAYDTTVYWWYNTLLRRPILAWWLSKLTPRLRVLTTSGVWRHGIWYWIRDASIDVGRFVEACDWAGLKIPTDGRCSSP